MKVILDSEEKRHMALGYLYAYFIRTFISLGSLANVCASGKAITSGIKRSNVAFD